MTLVEFLFTTIVVSFGAALQSSVGYGMGLVVVPFLILVDPGFIPGPMLVSAFTLSILVLLREKRSMDLNGLQWAIAGRIAGTFLAGWLILMISQDTLILLSAVLVLVAVVTTASGLRIALTRFNLVIAGGLAGIMGTIASIGGPPMALIYQHESGARIRTSLSGFFIVGTLISIATLTAIGKFGRHEATLGLLVLPGTVIGFLASGRFLTWLDRGHTRTAVLLVAAISAAVVIINQIW